MHSPNHTKDFNKNQVLSTDSVSFIKKTSNSFIKSKKKVYSFTEFLKTTDFYDEALEFSQKSKIEQSGFKPLFRLSTIKDLNDCGSWLEFREYTKLDKTSLHSANFCHRHKICKSCATRRSAKQVQKYNNIITASPELMAKKWYYIVLPVKHNIDESFDTVYNRVNEAINKIKKSRENKRGKTFFSQFDGIMIALEVTKSFNGWNVHLNLLCCTDNEISNIYKKGKTFVHDELIDNWKRVTDNDSYIVSINKLNFNDAFELKKNLLEVFKYTLKFSSMKNEDLLEVYKCTNRKRLLRGWGIFHNLKEDVDMNDEDLDDEYIELVLRFVNDGYIEHSRTKIVPAPGPKVLAVRKKQKPIRHILKKSRFIEIVHQDKNGFTIKKFFKRNLSSISDFEIFAQTMQVKLNDDDIPY